MDTNVQQRSVALLWNASSGWSDSDREREAICTLLAADGTHVDVTQVERGANIVERSKTIAQSGVDVLVAAGGDGTINAAASALVHGRTALGVIPAGTLNHFARDLGLPLEPQGAARILADGRITKVDAAAVNGRVFINNAVLGFFPEYREYRERFDARGFGSSRLGRFVATAMALCVTLWRLPHLKISVHINGRMRTLRTPFVLVGNFKDTLNEVLDPRVSNGQHGLDYLVSRCS
ncbi:MAG: diacylglycerol/lipid kinase family protein [Bryobacteraceae bacterium]